MGYVGTLWGAAFAFVLCFAASRTTGRNPWLRFAALRFLEFCRTVPVLVFALVFVVAFGLGPCRACWRSRSTRPARSASSSPRWSRTPTASPPRASRPRAANTLEAIRFGVLPQVLASFASYALLRFEINVREATVMGFVGAGGIGEELLIAIRRFYYSDVSAILVLVILTVFVIDLATELGCAARLFPGEAR